MRYFKKIIGREVYLSPMSAEEGEKFTEWLNDIDVSKYLTLAPKIINVKMEEGILARMCGEYNFAIVLKETGNALGVIGLMNVDLIHRSAELGMFIGDKNYWNRGYGTEAVGLMLDYAFNLLNLHNVSLQVIAFNTRAQRAYTKAGFKEIGRRREAYAVTGRRFDIIYMDILSSEYKSVYLENACFDENREKDFGKRLEIV